MRFNLTKLAAAVVVATSSMAYAETVTQLDEIVVTAEVQGKQSLGVSNISKEDLEKRPVQNDLSEVLRTMPGVNLTGNAAGSARGNKRQIDVRGMGPENTLILIDGRPVTSRNAERYGRSGERNTRGDSNWVPAEMIESIEVLRGPAAARYGSGAMGGVVNIKTKPATNEFHGSLNYYTNQPQDSKEGATNRVGFAFSGPLIKDKLAFRLYGNWNKTDADSANINAQYNDLSAQARSRNNAKFIAGREGVRNKDIAGRIDWNVTDNQKVSIDISNSRQGNIYNGDTQTSSGGNIGVTSALNGQETARLYRQSYAITHTGKYGWGDSKLGFSWDRTTNSRLKEALTGNIEGAYAPASRNPNETRASGFSDSVLKNSRLNGELNIPFTLGFDQMLTIGAEFAQTKLDDGASTSQSLVAKTNRRTGQETPDSYAGIGQNRTGLIKRTEWAVFLEDNIAASDRTFVTPAVRYNYSDDAGSVVTGGLNVAHNITDNLKIKGGVARAFKNPNLYQANPNYMIYSNGRSCRILPEGFVPCYLLGSADLKPEISWNKEIGLEYSKDDFTASVAYFNNDYRNKIIAGTEAIAITSAGREVYQWKNAKRAIVEGVEGNLTLPLVQDKLRLVNNFTYMIQSKDKETGNPLSIIPKYTLNSSLNWTPTEAFDANLTYTQYGRQKPRTVATTPREQMELNPTTLGSYSVWGVNAGYKWNKAISVRAGVSNLFDKQIKRSNAGAATYNQPGRAYYASVKYEF
ncbi:TonB-dependent siderophore receptor [Haemophilus paracuniculus]|uniref:TonB-dependent siderophore receptor n=1 Tax=Haemophilus paracuniculus TaxID=734 RepID=A0A1T0ATY9_9PAST|nr:FepA family TonB-dependent siderophore receptor [Haemophilus paracuniculus]OOR99940.1 TonB-dependent siderophore receptor [Haemophilus paracuniculus]